MLKVLVVFCEVPEDTTLVEIDATPDEAETLRSFHGHYINSIGTPDELQQQMNDYFYPNNGIFKFQDQKEKQKEPFLDKKYDLVIMCGFFM